jgi:hypothetical protein
MTLKPRPAPDPMGLAANEAMIAVSGLDVLLALASSPNVEREVRRTAVVSAFARWRQVARAFADLERVASASAAAGYEIANRAEDVKERAA